MTQTTKVVPVSSLKNEMTRVKELAEKYALKAIGALDGIERAVMQAEGIRTLREAMQPLMPALMPLMNTQLGFDTDKNPARGQSSETYSVEVVRDVLIEGLLRGASLVGNEINIIAQKFYGTVNFYKRMVEEMTGMTDLQTPCSPPFTTAGHTCVRCNPTWKLDGVGMRLRDTKGESGRIYAITVHSKTGIDAIIGKARRRMYRDIYLQCTGSHFTDQDVEDIPALAAPPTDAKTRTEEVIDAAVKVASGEKPDGPASIPQLEEISKLRHVVQDEYFQMLLEERGRLEVDQLTRVQAESLLDVLHKAQANKN